jgi:hypothetical protein
MHSSALDYSIALQTSQHFMRHMCASSSSQWQTDQLACAAARFPPAQCYHRILPVLHALNSHEPHPPSTKQPHTRPLKSGQPSHETHHQQNTHTLDHIKTSPVMRCFLTLRASSLCCTCCSAAIGLAPSAAAGELPGPLVPALAAAVGDGAAVGWQPLSRSMCSL